ncbi:MAG TPA: TIGR03435 family protein [Bryobacteraceae bacterium]|jgi:uncharacterized protein (TIGR03435 family)|nr:TIGR03435 family protein [Bryobacteraceae bacterium]
MKTTPVALILAAAALYAQPQPTFDAASVKASDGRSERSSVRFAPGLLTISNAPLRKCIALAYDIQEDREDAISAPDWLRDARFDILAKFPPNTSEVQARAMFQNLLAERFQLKVHRESRELTVYALTVDKSGSKLIESAPEKQGTIGLSAERLTGRGVPVQALADRLASAAFQLGRPVVDRTGLIGTFDFTLEWKPESGADGYPEPSLFTAIQEQLGLKLEKQKGTVEVLVVDSALRKPIEN